MLTESEKLAQRDTFVKSTFGLGTFHTLFMFKQNSLGILSTVGFIGNLIEKINDKNTFPTKLNDEQLIQIKQYLVVDIISKLLTIIEGLLVLIHSLSIDYDTTTKNMIKYPQGLVWDIIHDLNQDKYDFEKIMALPPVDDLPLTNEEKNGVKNFYQKSNSCVKESLKVLGEFYQKYNIVYNKSKHGLSLSPLGFLENQKDRTFANSSLSAFDHKNNEDLMPKNYHVVTPDDNSDAVWFNVESRLNFNKKLFGEIGDAINNLEALCSTVVDNHLTYANNCGQNYLPVHTTTPGKYSISFLNTTSMTEKEIKLLEILNQKVLKDMLVNPIEYNMRRTYTKKSLIEVLTNDPVINIFLRLTDETN